MSCKYCAELEEYDGDEKDDFVIMHGPDLELMSPECNMKAFVGYWGSGTDPSDRTWGIDIVLDEEWYQSIPIKVGLPCGSYDRNNDFSYEAKLGFDCHEVIVVNYCPMCGEKLGGER